MTSDNFCFYLQNRIIQTSQTGGQWYSDTSPFSNPWWIHIISMKAAMWSSVAIDDITYLSQDEAG